MIRQGDVLLKKIEKIPSNTKKKDLVLAYGEVTGHKHVLQDGNVYIDDNGTQYVQLAQDTMLCHEEHNNILIPTGTYQVILQREYDIVSGVRAVLD